MINYIFDLKNFNEDILKSETLTVRKDNKRVQVSLNYNYQMYSRSFKYKKSHKGLKCKSLTKINLFPPIVWGIYRESNSIFIDEEDNLILYHNHAGALMLGAFPIGGASVGQLKGAYKLMSN